MNATELPLPDFYDPAHAARWDHRPDQQALLGAAMRWRDAHRIAPAARRRPAITVPCGRIRRRPGADLPRRRTRAGRS